MLFDAVKLSADGSGIAEILELEFASQGREQKDLGVGLLSADRINIKYMQRNVDEQTIQWNLLTLTAMLLMNGAGFSCFRF